MGKPDDPPRARSGSEVQARLVAESIGRSFVVYHDAAGVQQLLELDGDRSRLAIGRNERADIAIGWDAEVSRLHAELVCSGGAWLVVDEGLSSNGTFVNGHRLASRSRLRDGDVIRVGSTVLLFRAPEAEAALTLQAGAGVTVDQLNATQRKVLAALCRPYTQASHLASPASNRQIASELFVSLDTVKANLRALFRIFDLEALPQNQKRGQLAELAIAWGLISAEPT